MRLFQTETFFSAVGQDNGGDSFIFNSDKEYLSLENLDDDSLSPPQLEELEDAFGDNNSDEEFHDAVSFPDIINYNVDHSFSAESPETAVVNAATDDKDMMFDALGKVEKGVIVVVMFFLFI